MTLPAAWPAARRPTVRRSARRRPGRRRRGGAAVPASPPAPARDEAAVAGTRQPTWGPGAPGRPLRVLRSGDRGGIRSPERTSQAGQAQARLAPLARLARRALDLRQAEATERELRQPRQLRLPCACRRSRSTIRSPRVVRPSCCRAPLRESTAPLQARVAIRSAAVAPVV